MLEKYKKLMEVLKFESRPSFDDVYYWYGEKKLMYEGLVLPQPMIFHITIKTIPNNEDDIIITTKLKVPTNETTYDMPINKNIEFMKDYFKYELRNIKVDKLLNG